jgi:hypothetical protein
MSTALPSWLLRSDARYCRPCDRRVVSRPRPRFAGLGIAGTVALVLVLVGFSALIGPFIMFAVPLILAAGFALGPLAALASEPPSCPHCRRELIFGSRRESLLRAERTRAHGTAPVGDMKAA